MKLMHYAAQEVWFDPDRRYEQREPHSFGKPEGFWVSVEGEDDWPSWCRGEECFIDSLAVAHQVTLVDRPNLLIVSTPVGIDSLTATYAVQTEWERRFSWKVNNRRKWPIDWREVSRDYDGVIIAPYQWSRRMETEWYYGWDCASGCIWNLDAIASVETVGSEVTA